jgi:Glycosyltransferase family 87/WD40-like Beta Propeller Repeat
MEKRSRLEDSESSAVDPAPYLNTNLRRWLHLVEWLLLASLVAHFCVRTMSTVWQEENVDYVDYYLPAALVHQHYDTSRVYEWVWLQRQKDHRGINQQIINLVPSTLFSTLMQYPFTGMPVLAAKRCWLIANFGLLLATLYLLRSITGLPWRRIGIVAAFSFPLRVNFVAGQYYVLLLLLLTLACYLYLRQRRFLAGVMVGFAAGLKIFPVIYLIYFLRKRDWNALAGGVAGCLSAAVISVLIFGWEANRTFLLQVLPPTLRGDVLAPYAFKIASLSVLLHRLFIYEPQLNPHPAINAAWLFAVLQPVLQMAVAVPALMLAIPGDNLTQQDSSEWVKLEWSATLLASLAISTSPQTYHFTLLILPAVLVMDALWRRRAYLSLAILLPLYVVTGYVSGSGGELGGWSALLGVPRLYALLLSCGLLYLFMIRQRPDESSKRDRLAWVFVLGAVVTLSIFGNLRHLRGLYDDYAWRIPIPKEANMAVSPVVVPGVDGDAIHFIAMINTGYHAAVALNGKTQFNNAKVDELAISVANGERWVEQAKRESTVVSTLASQKGISNAESPAVSFDGRLLAYLREDHGRARLWVRTLGKPTCGVGDTDQPATPPELNVLEMSFLPSGDLIFAATSGGRPRLFATDSSRAGRIRSLGKDFGTGEARYPAVSPDGRWLAYSRLDRGNWNLWLHDLNSGEQQRLTNAECNATDPAWTADSKTLVYASDCGRALWYYTLVRRRVVP